MNVRKILNKDCLVISFFFLPSFFSLIVIVRKLPNKILPHPFFLSFLLYSFSSFCFFLSLRINSFSRLSRKVMIVFSFTACPALFHSFALLFVFTHFYHFMGNYTSQSRRKECWNIIVHSHSRSVIRRIKLLVRLLLKTDHPEAVFFIGDLDGPSGQYGLIIQ